MKPAIPSPRLRRQAEAIHALGPRPLASLLAELAAGAPFEDRVEAYARLPAALIAQRLLDAEQDAYDAFGRILGLHPWDSPVAREASDRWNDLMDACFEFPCATIGYDASGSGARFGSVFWGSISKRGSLERSDGRVLRIPMRDDRRLPQMGSICPRPDGAPPYRRLLDQGPSAHPGRPAG
ncbi:hypothetical protein [Methylocella sp.]|uniref:hypothetical protein n=1 Tax=Methylocella sp. TaxID=1978226 RepID=UPI003784D37E